MRMITVRDAGRDENGILVAARVKVDGRENAIKEDDRTGAIVSAIGDDVTKAVAAAVDELDQLMALLVSTRHRLLRLPAEEGTWREEKEKEKE